MQSTVLSQIVTPEESGDTRIFPLDGILPDGDAFVINTKSRSLSYISQDEEGSPRLIAHITLGEFECKFALLLFTHFPYYVPYEYLYAAFYTGDTFFSFEDKRIQEIHAKLQDALSLGEWGKETRQPRRCVSRTRLKLKTLGLGLRSLVETGYILMYGKPVSKDRTILHYSLDGLLPAGQVLAVVPKTNRLLLLEKGRILGEEHLAPDEMLLLDNLLNNFPFYCPAEVLLGNFNHRGKATQPQIIATRKELQEALLRGHWTHEMAPIRNLLSRVRKATRPLGIDIFAIVEIGYILMSLPQEPNTPYKMARIRRDRTKPAPPKRGRPVGRVPRALEEKRRRAKN